MVLYVSSGKALYLVLLLAVQFILSADMGYQFNDGNPPTNAPPAFVQVPVAHQYIVFTNLCQHKVCWHWKPSMELSHKASSMCVCLPACGSPCILFWSSVSWLFGLVGCALQMRQQT